MSRGAAVTGLGCICAAGPTLEAIMRSLYAGQRRCGPSTFIQADLDMVYPVFEVASPLDEPLELPLNTKASRSAKLALIAAREAIHDAGLAPEALKSLRVGVAIGTTVGCTLNNEPFYRDFRLGKLPDPGPVRQYLENNPARLLATLWGLKGPAVTIANACSSGTDAIGLARAWLNAGICDLAIAGGADELSRITYLGFIHLLITAAEPCRPFDRRRRGLNLGEGAGVVVLETRESAQRRGATVHAEVIGYGCHSDAHHLTAPHPEGKGLRRAITAALRDAGLTPGEVGFINAHGTSTPDNDRIEGTVLAELFPSSTPIVSTKAYTGHTLGAAGGIEAALTVQALRDQRLPATLGFAEPDPDCKIAPTTANTPVRARVALSDSLAFGGNNSVLVFRRDS